MLATDVLLGAVAALAGFTDWRARKIPNWLTVSGVVAGCAVNSCVAGWPGLGLALAGAGLALAVHMPLFLLRASGGGDVKLMTAAGAILGPRDWIVLFAISAVLGGVFSLALIVWKGALRRTLRNVGHVVRRLIRLRAPHVSRSELDVTDERSLTIPRGLVVAIAVALFLFTRG